MSIRLFKKPYTVRKHGEQVLADGYPSSPYNDKIVWLNVQPVSPDRLEVRPEGDVTVVRLKSWGSDKLASADEHNGVIGDLLYYHGLWYECKSSVMWDHTILSHYQSDFVVLPATKQKNQKPPEVVP